MAEKGREFVFIGKPGDEAGKAIRPADFETPGLVRLDPEAEVFGSYKDAGYTLDTWLDKTPYKPEPKTQPAKE